MKMIVGLGNPGKEYENTRHNIGFMALDSLASFFNVSFDQKKNEGLFCQFFYEQEKIILLKPQKYMNLSGQVVKKFVDYFKVSVEDILIIHDDLDLDVGRLRCRLSGSSGGHNGLKDIQNHIGTKDYKRLKIGISNNKNMQTKNYVLGKFSKEEQEKIDSIINNIPIFFEDYMHQPFLEVMNRYNKKKDA